MTLSSFSSIAEGTVAIGGAERDSEESAKAASAIGIDGSTSSATGTFVGPDLFCISGFGMVDLVPIWVCSSKGAESLGAVMTEVMSISACGVLWRLRRLISSEPWEVWQTFGSSGSEGCGEGVGPSFLDASTKFSTCSSLSFSSTSAGVDNARLFFTGERERCSRKVASLSYSSGSDDRSKHRRWGGMRVTHGVIRLRGRGLE